MKISISWLQEYLSGPILASEVARKLTEQGIEVEGIEEIGKEISGVFAAKIVSARPHPNADKLSLCTVDDGKERDEVVCGAKNWKVGDVVPFAKVGATLPGGITITPKPLKGIESRGMLCSEKELGLSEEASGLWILPPDTTPGTDIAKAVRDTVLVLGVTPNRPDCLSHIGVAREIAAAFDLTLKMPEAPLIEHKDKNEDHCKVLLEETEGCPRYAARIIRGVAIQPSPLWLQRRLQAVGVRAISNVVDVTNFVMMELGQPLHAFDLHCLAKQTIRVRRAESNEKLKTLDGQERTLSDNGNVDLVIADAEKSVAIAGVMGGLTSEVTNETKDILLESAYFHPSWVRKTAKRQRMHTDASHRFERGCDPDGVPFAQDRALSLMQQLAGGEVLSGRVDAYPKPIPKQQIALRAARVRQVLGVDAPQNLSPLGLVKLDQSEAQTLWEIPNFRPDLEREIDLVEEVARLYGIDQIPARVPKMSMTTEPAKELLSPVTEVQKLREAARLAGLSEAVCYAFCGSDVVAKIPWPEGDQRAQPVRLANPIADDLDVLRPSLLPGLLLSVARNQRRQRGAVRLFEIGRVFLPREGVAPAETLRFSAIIAGEEARWWGKDAPDFFWVKGLVELLFGALFLPSPSARAASLPFLIEGAAAMISSQEHLVGEIGELHPEVLERFEITGRAFWLSLDIHSILQLTKPAITFKELSRFPAVTRDIAMLSEQSLTWEAVARCIEETRSTMLQEISLFDLYQGPNLPAGHKSMALSLTYQSSEKTLTDEEVQASHDAICKALVEKLQIKIR